MNPVLARVVTTVLASMGTLLGTALAAPQSSQAGLNLPAPLMHGSRQRPEVALTFDADMTPFMRRKLEQGVIKSFDDGRIRAYLEREGIHATFFLTGMWAEQYPKAALELARNPLFELGNHSYSHPGFVSPCYTLAKLPPGGARAEIEAAQAAIFEATAKTPHFFRFPGLCHDPAALETVASLGLEAVDGDAIGQDGFQKNPAVIEKNVLSSVQNGSIIVLHCHGGPNAPATFAALEQIVPKLRSRGFSFVTLSALVR